MTAAAVVVTAAAAVAAAAAADEAEALSVAGHVTTRTARTKQLPMAKRRPNSLTNTDHKNQCLTD